VSTATEDSHRFAGIESRTSSGRSEWRPACSAGHELDWHVSKDGAYEAAWDHFADEILEGFFSLE